MTPNNLEHAKAQILALELKLTATQAELETKDLELRRIQIENINLRHSMSIRDINDDLRKTQI